MSPIPRCDLRLPTVDRKKSGRLDAKALKVAAKQKASTKDDLLATVAAVTDQTNQPTTGASSEAPSETRVTSEFPGTAEPAVEPAAEPAAETTRKPAEETTQKPAESPTKGVPVGCLASTAIPENEDETKENCDPVPEGRVRADPNTDEAIKTKAEVKSGEITRDTADSIRGSVKMHDLAFGEITNPVCTTGEEEGLVPKVDWASCPGAPGDTTYDWLVFERPESPGGSLPPADNKMEDLANLTPTQIEERMCKKRISKFKYVKMWGSEEAIRRWTRQKLESRRLRKQLEKKHAQNSWLREKMRVHARMKRRMYRCKDQSKIPSLNEDIQINKAFYFRFNYNQQVPCMPADMNKHFAKFKKPPFRNKAPCINVKAVDEFEKLRVQKKQPSP